MTLYQLVKFGYVSKDLNFFLFRVSAEEAFWTAKTLKM
jgi:hypothetical protein